MTPPESEGEPDIPAVTAARSNEEALVIAKPQIVNASEDDDSRS